MNTQLENASPTTVNRTVGPSHRRKHLTPSEVDKLIAAAKHNRHGHRDSTMILIAYRHGLRASEVCGLQWDQFDLVRGNVHVDRTKSGDPSNHELTGSELRALKRLQREQGDSRYVFITERGAPFTVDGFRKMVIRLGESINMPFQIHPHMLRHACGFKLASDGIDTRRIQAYLGHRNIQSTQRYTKIAEGAFKGFWKD
jgi:integrase